MAKGLTNTEKDMCNTYTATQIPPFGAGRTPDFKVAPMATVLDWCLQKMGIKEDHHAI